MNFRCVRKHNLRPRWSLAVNSCCIWLGLVGLSINHSFSLYATKVFIAQIVCECVPWAEEKCIILKECWYPRMSEEIGYWQCVCEVQWLFLIRLNLMASRVIAILQLICVSLLSFISHKYFFPSFFYHGFIQVCYL